MAKSPTKDGKESDVTPTAEESDVTQDAEKSAVTPAGEESDVIPAGEESYVTPAAEESDVTPAGEESAVMPTGEESAVTQAGEESAVTQASEESVVMQAGEESDVTPAAEESAVMPTGEESEVTPAAEESAVAQAGEESDVSPAGEEMLDFDDNTLRAIAEVYHNEGNEKYRQEDFSNAIHFYTEGIQVNCNHEELKARLYSGRAEAYFCLGNYSDSLNDAKIATDLQPSLVEAIVRGTRTCVQLNQFEEAIIWCEKGLAFDKNNQMLLELRSRAVNEQNKLQNATGKDDANESDVTTATKQSPDNNNETTSRAKVEFFKNQGNDEFRKKEFSQAILLYTKGINVDVKDQELKAKLYSNRATAHFNLGNFHDSQSDAKTATDLQPSYVKAIVTGASACFQLNQFEEAISWCDKGLPINENNQKLLELKSRSVSEQNKLQGTGEEATKDLSETQTLQNTDMKSMKKIPDSI